MPISPSDYQPFAEQHEGNIPWMYLDTVGNVTVGIGHLIASAAAAEALPFIDPDSGSPYEIRRIPDAYRTVRDARNLIGRSAGAFRRLTRPRLGPGASAELFRHDFERIVGRCRALFDGVGRGFDGYPRPAQLALVDMAFNLGPDGLFRKFPRLRTEGLARGDYAVAAAESRRLGVSPTRNSWTRRLLTEAARASLSA